MSLLAGINLVLGLAGQIGANNAASRAARLAELQRQQALDKVNADDAARAKWYQDQVASGAYNPTDRIALADQTATHDLRNEVGNLQGGALAAGYQAGDTNIEQGSRTLSQNAQLKLAAMEQGIRGQARNDQMAGMNFAAPRSSQMILNQGNIDETRANSRYVNPAGLLASGMGSNVFDFLKGSSGGSTGGGGSTVGGGGSIFGGGGNDDPSNDWGDWSQ